MQTYSTFSIRCLLSVTIVAIVAACCTPITVIAEDAVTTYKEGDRVEVDAHMSNDPKYQKWQKATIVKVEMWQGKVAGYHLKTEDGALITSAARFMRPAAEAAPQDPPVTTDKQAPPQQPPVKPPAQAQFKVGDRVEVDTLMAKDPKDSVWIKATVKAVEPQNQRIVVMRDDHNEMSVLIRPGKVWIRPLNDGSKPPTLPGCKFNKDFIKVSNSAPASAELFKAVIYNWKKEINEKYIDFGLTFEVFQMAAPFKNKVYANGMKTIDSAPAEAAIYPIKAREITCQKDLNVTIHTVQDIEYSCYKDKFNTWVCKNGAPQNVKRTSIPNK